MVCRINEWRPVLGSSHLFTKGLSGDSRSGSSWGGVLLFPEDKIPDTMLGLDFPCQDDSPHKTRQTQ